MVSFLYGKLLCVQQRALLCKCLILKKGDFLFFLNMVRYKKPFNI